MGGVRSGISGIGSDAQRVGFNVCRLATDFWLSSSGNSIKPARREITDHFITLCTRSYAEAEA